MGVYGSVSSTAPSIGDTTFCDVCMQNGDFTGSRTYGVWMKWDVKVRGRL